MPSAAIASKIAVGARKKIFQKLLTSPVRRKLYKRAAPYVEELAEHPATRRAYMFGSFATKKRAPSDVDLVVRVGDAKRTPSTLLRKGKEYGVDTTPTGSFSSVGTRGLREYGKKKYGPKSKWIRVIGAAGAAGGLAMAEEAEASPAGVFTKAATKAAKGMISSASKLLKGFQIQPNKVIKEVRKGRGVWRSILFEDGTTMTVEQKYVNDLCRARGTQLKMGELTTKSGDAKTLQALRSLKFHEARVRPFFTRDMIRKMHTEHLKRLKEVGEDLRSSTTAYVVHRNKYFPMPREYAEILQEQGIVKIMKGLRDIQSLKGLVK